MTQVAFGVVGLGAIAAVHIDAILRVPQARLVAVASRDPVRGQAIASDCGCEWAGSYEELVLRDDIDVIDICTASGAHLEPALAAAAAGKHVLVEKPLEVTLERCDAMIEACERSGVHLGGVFQSRFYDGNILTHEAVASGRFGRLVHGAAYVDWWRSQEYYDQADWRGTWRLDGGGAVMNQAIHQVDLLQWMMGQVESIFAFADCLAHHGLEVEDTAVAVLRFANGALGVIEAMTSAYPGYAKRLEVHGDQGGAILEDDKIVSWQGLQIAKAEQEAMHRRFSTAAGGDASADPMAISHVGHERQIADFAEVVIHNRRPAVTGIDARKAVAIIEALYNSARTGLVCQVCK